MKFNQLEYLKTGRNKDNRPLRNVKKINYAVKKMRKIKAEIEDIERSYTRDLIYKLYSPFQLLLHLLEYYGFAVQEYSEVLNNLNLSIINEDQKVIYTTQDNNKNLKASNTNSDNIITKSNIKQDKKKNNLVIFSNNNRVEKENKYKFPINEDININNTIKSFSICETIQYNILDNEEYKDQFKKIIKNEEINIPINNLRNILSLVTSSALFNISYIGKVTFVNELIFTLTLLSIDYRLKSLKMDIQNSVKSIISSLGNDEWEKEVIKNY